MMRGLRPSMDVVDVIDRLIITNSEQNEYKIGSNRLSSRLFPFRQARKSRTSLLKEIVQNQYSASNHPHPTLHPPLFDMCSFAFQNYRFTASAVR
jgi:hypothetical protein